MQQTAPTEPTTVQTGPTTVETGNTTVETGGTTVQTEQITLHDFTLGLLTDLDAREAFQQDPLGCLEAAGLSDITATDVHEILPLVLDAASVPNVDAVQDVLGGELPAVDSLLQIAGNVGGVTGLAGAGDVAGLTGIAAPSAITALVSDFSGLGDVSNTLDATVLKGTDVVSNVSDIATDNSIVTKVTDVASVSDVTTDVHDVSNVLVKDLDTDVLTKNVVDTDVLVKHTDVLVKDVADVHDTVDLSHNVVQDVAQVGDIHHNVGQVIGDVNLGDINVLDGIGNHNDVDVHF
ncbi:IniB N-terminal domain-containing protein [Lentzea sp. NPDC006480]|uniref:IniB N-terminal domain-containing protein n=1 Tax=Lentzea sp. NPDC006480 TaxID=3157176 RepID=UPI0033BE52D5